MRSPNLPPRAGRAFAGGGLAALPHFYAFDAYREPEPPVKSGLVDFVVKNRERIENALGPVIAEVGARYWSLRPRTATSHAGSQP